MTTQRWTNESTEALGYATWSGTATCMPSLGPAGLLVFVGGAKGRGSGQSNESDPVSFTNVTIYDPDSREWYWQLTTGGPPDPRVDFCSVGVPGKNGTYEIWFKAASEGPARAMHGCAVVGNRQMISIGGNDNTKMNGWRDKDPWEQGIGILDLPSMTWAEQYNAAATDYDSPLIVKDWYKRGAITQWDSKSVAKLFASLSPGTPGTQEERKPILDPSLSGGIPIGAIVGGVVGGVTLIAVIVIACILIRKRRKGHAMKDNEDWNKVELPAGSHRIVVRHEMDSNRQHEELPAKEAIEMSVVEKGQEACRHTKRYELEG
ncbi:hypothetical protein ACHAO9_006826 [Fusarium lateritium]